jgi:hypothetical protein
MPLQGMPGRGIRASLALLLAAGLSACGGGVSLDSVPNLLAFNSSTAPPTTAKAITHVDCPEVAVLDGTAAIRNYAGAAANTNLRYQFSLGDIARECSVEGGQIGIKVGVQGRVLIGPVGAPGTFTAPVRVAIRSESDHKPIVSQMYKVPVTVPPGATEAPFSLVTDPLHVPLLSEQADVDYSILVGFDEAGAAAAAPKTPRHRRKPAE